MRIINKNFKLYRQQGSTLVATLAFSLILSLGGTGYLMLSNATIEDEAQVLMDEQALQAAESVLLMGTRWLRAQPSIPTSSKYHVLGSIQTINGMVCWADVLVNGGTIRVRGNAGKQEAKYIRSLSWGARRKTIGDLGTFVRTLSPGGDVGGGGLTNVTFDGPFHTNEPIVFSSVSNPTAGGAGVLFKNGAVTVFNHTDSILFDKKDQWTKGGDWGNYGDGAYNNYEFGVYDKNIKPGTKAGAAFDQTFTNTFKHSQDSLILGPMKAPDLVLPTSHTDATDDNDAAHRPTLLFRGDGSALYYTWVNLGGGVWNVDIDTLSPGAINGKLLRVPNSDVNILGTLNGQVSVTTDADHSMFVTGDLVYSGFTRSNNSDYDNWESTNNYGVGDVSSNNNVLGLISGKDLFFGAEWIDPRDGGSAAVKDVTSWYSADNSLFFMAELIAVDSSGNTMFRQKLGGGTTSIALLDYTYDLRFIGSRCMDQWFSYSAGGTAANTKFRFYNDSRLQQGLSAPKMPDVLSWDASNLTSMVLSDWEEKSHYSLWGLLYNP